MAILRTVAMLALAMGLVMDLTSGAQAQSWTSFVSEEQGEHSPAQCNDGPVSGLRCSGRYCDGVSLGCAPGQEQSESWWGPYFSEETPSQFLCPEGSFVSGARCSGRFCDSMSLRCTTTPRLKIERCYWTPSISEENGGTINYGAGTYLRGLRCSGRYCDSLSSYVCQTAPSECTSESCRAERASRFAPLLRFDQVQGSSNKCFPSDAESYYELRKSGSDERVCNTDVASITQGDEPIYYAYQDCSQDTTVIMYWFFYGYQDTCTGNAGSHDADWERVAVKIRGNQVERVLFFQHGGSYTRQGGGMQLFEQTHPVAYVGKNSHGSYHDDGGSGSCLYFEDYRNPGGRDLSMRTWQNLVELHDDASAPEWMRSKSSEHFDGIPGPLARGIDLCSMQGCSGKDARVGALCFGQCGCSKSDVGDSPF